MLSRWTPPDLLVNPPEGALRFVTERGRDLGNGISSAAQFVCSNHHSPSGQVVHRCHCNLLSELLSEDGAGHTHAIGEFL
jgi:hypothetical protein